MKHIHVPLSEDLHTALLMEAKQSGESATSIARQAIEQSLRARRRQARRVDISAYAAAQAGSEFDLDTDLEAAGLEVLTETR